MLLQVKNIIKSYYSDKGILICRALEDVTLLLEDKEQLVITGPSGSGKSSLLNILGLIDVPDSGDVFFKGEGFQRMGQRRQEEFRNQNTGFIFQDHHLLKHCTVLENVLIPCLAFKNKTTFAEREKAKSILNRLGIFDKQDYLPSMLSGGERQRAAFARSLINSPDLILADEPTGNLDRGNSERAMEFLLSFAREEGTALIVVTHADHVASLFKKKYSLIDGRLERQRS